MSGSAAFNPEAGLFEYAVQTELGHRLSAPIGGAPVQQISYGIDLIGIDPNDQSTKYNVKLNPSAANIYLQKYLHGNDEFEGQLDHLQVNKDGTSTLLLQGKDLGIFDFDKNGQQIGAYGIRKANYGVMRNTGTASVCFEDGAGPFFGYVFLSTPHGCYVFLNAHPGDFKKGLEATPGLLTGVSDANTACFRIDEGGPSRFYLFGEPNDQFDNRLANVATAQYNEYGGDLAVMIIEKHGRKKQARIAWVDFK